MTKSVMSCIESCIIDCRTNWKQIATTLNRRRLAASNMYKSPILLPLPIVFKLLSSYVMQELVRKMTFIEDFPVMELTDRRLNLNIGTHNTSSITKFELILTVQIK